MSLKKRQDYIWNTAAGLLNSAEAVIMSMIVTRITGLTDAGILTIAFALGNLMMTIGKFGVRNFQVTDTKHQYPFAVYFKTRLLTVVAMIVVTVGYLLYAFLRLDYYEEKLEAIFLICLIYIVEAVEDVFWGYYQQKGYLAVGAKLFCARWSSILVTFFTALFLAHNLVIALLWAFLISVIVFLMMLRKTYPQICERKEQKISLRISRDHVRTIRNLLIAVFPLFVNSFLALYVSNAPKYAIDACMTDEIQACYGFVAMPVFVIGLLNNFIYQPVLVPMSIEWEQRQYGRFFNRVVRQFVIIVIITATCLLGAAVWGIPALSWLYHTDLADYKAELLILLTAGGFLAVSGYLSVVLTIMRYQRNLLWPYCLAAAIALVSLRTVVLRYGTVGAAVCYMALMMILCIIYGIIFAVRFNREKAYYEPNE